MASSFAHKGTGTILMMKRRFVGGDSNTCRYIKPKCWTGNEADNKFTTMEWCSCLISLRPDKNYLVGLFVLVTDICDDSKGGLYITMEVKVYVTWSLSAN